MVHQFVNGTVNWSFSKRVSAFYDSDCDWFWSDVIWYNAVILNIKKNLKQIF